MAWEFSLSVFSHEIVFKPFRSWDQYRYKRNSYLHIVLSSLLVYWLVMNQLNTKLFDKDLSRYIYGQSLPSDFFPCSNL